MARSKRRSELKMSASRLVLDSGAVIALSRGDSRARAFLTRALKLEVDIEVPVVVVAETLRGTARDAPVHLALNAFGRVRPTTKAIGKLAGRLLGEAHSSHTVDALVVAQAIDSGGGAILTSDPDDLERLAGGWPAVHIEAL